MNPMGRLPRAVLLLLFLARTSAAQIELPPETVFGRTGLEEEGLSGTPFTSPVPAFASDLREALEKMPGLQLLESFGGIEPPRLTVRGSGVQSAPVSRGVVLRLDGYPLGFADGSFNTALADTVWIDYARLTPGPAAGVAALGGDLAFRSALLEPYDGGEAVAAIGQDNSVALSAWGRRAYGGRRLAAGLSGRRTDGWRDYGEQRRESAIASFRVPLDDGDRREIQFHLLAARPRLEVPGPLPLPEALGDPESVSAAVRRDRPRRESGYLRLGSRLRMDSEAARASLGASGVLYEDEFRQLLPNGITRTSAVEGSLFGALGRDWDGLRKQRTDARLSLLGGWRAVTRDRNTGGTSGPRIGDNRLRAETLTLALDHAILPRPEWEVEAGASLIHARRRIGERFATSSGRPSTALDLVESRLAPRVAVSWLPSEELQATLSLARTYEPPTFDDLFFTTGPLAARQLASAPLDWQRADQIELVLRGGGTGWSWWIAGYAARWKREFLRLLDEQGNPRGTVNAGATRRTGLEVFLERSFHESGPITLSGWTTLQWTRFRFDDDPVFGDNRIGGVAPFSGALGLEATSPGGWFLAPSVRGQSGRLFADHANTLAAPDFAVLNLDLGRRHPSGWTFYFGVENLLDKRYIASPAGVLDRAGPVAATSVFLPGAGRRWEAGFHFTW